TDGLAGRQQRVVRQAGEGIERQRVQLRRLVVENHAREGRQVGSVVARRITDEVVARSRAESPQEVRAVGGGIALEDDIDQGGSGGTVDTAALGDEFRQSPATHLGLIEGEGVIEQGGGECDVQTAPKSVADIVGAAGGSLNEAAAAGTA